LSTAFPSGVKYAVEIYTNGADSVSDASITTNLPEYSTGSRTCSYDN